MNPWPQRCERCALPAELHPQKGRRFRQRGDIYRGTGKLSSKIRRLGPFSGRVFLPMKFRGALPLQKRKRQGKQPALTLLLSCPAGGFGFPATKGCVVTLRSKGLFSPHSRRKAVNPSIPAAYRAFRPGASVQHGDRAACGPGPAPVQP